MNRSHSVIALWWVHTSTPAGCSPRGLGGVCDSFEGFSMLYRGTLLCLSPRSAFWSSFVEFSWSWSSPRASARARSIRVLSVFIVRPSRIL
jgi:hypothetical protein